MENNEEKKMDEKNFNLSKVKILPNGGLQAEYQISEIVNDNLSIADFTATHNRDLHPDLLGLFKDLRTIVARVFNITSFLSLLESDDMKLSAAAKAKARLYADELVSKINVCGVSWSGSDENIGVIITAVYKTPNGLKTCINTPRIKLAQISFGFEEELETILDSIRKEVFAFLFNGKQAQLSLFGEQPE